ncbi:TetR/AcrR family transcriptional regulator [Lactiplantibacillus plantarum]|uniref:TetR/AcrR family transcriptional regulator n=1 Tax=Lactiplantibacillus plantarum TaxID=1590 RepID=UPI0015871EEC|nr:TetR/AcrR family transcriptional regulator [Lactiplantibacillus plantarum]MBP5841224.1 TetR/AcrR family transcriptional regulator [Lactiplantibacillus plantarum]
MTDNQEKILNAFKQLLIENGYTKTTTRKIASLAGVNELTIFKNFKDKEGLLNAAVNDYLHDVDEITSSITLSGNVETDLIMLSRRYQNFINDHQAIVLAGFREAFEIPSLNIAVQKIPLYFKHFLMAYFKKMQTAGVIKQHLDVEAQAMSFIWLNFGYFLTRQRFSNPEISFDLTYFLQNNIKSFVNGLTK